MSTAILGVSAYYHDSAAALVVDGDIVAAAQEERFTRVKHDARFPARAIASCLEIAGLTLADVASVVFYEKPWIKFERLLETYVTVAPKGVRSFLKAMPPWLKEKLFLRREIQRELEPLGGAPKILFAEHHQSHAASAFYPSPFEKAAVLCLDGVGEWATTSVWLGDGARLEPKWELHFPHSLGLLYTAFTYHAGFKVNSGEYKLMGLAPYGEPRFAGLIREKLVDVKDDGTFALDTSYFDFEHGLRMTNERFDALFEGPPRKPEAPITRREVDLARSIQLVTEEIVLRLARTIHRELEVPNLCLAGGVALNCVANGRLVREGPFEKLWIQPAAGDAGGALGAALVAWHEHEEKPRTVRPRDAMKGSLLGPRPKTDEARALFDRVGAPYEQLDDAALFDRVAALLEAGHVVGFVQGPMEFGPRALGARSILGDARHPKMQSTMNLKIKFRESFRPFAPAVLAHRARDWFDIDRESPYMLLVADVARARRREMTADERALFGIDKLNVVRSEIPAVTHVDHSARVQTVAREDNPRFFDLLTAFEKRTGCPVLVNTSFNVRGEPVVCTPEDAYRCFRRTEMDYLVVENLLLDRARQPPMTDLPPMPEPD